jgi:hypothetical protein
MTRAQSWPTHQCCHPACMVMIPMVQLACGAHWSELPQEVRSRLWTMYRNGRTRAQALEDCRAFFRVATSEVVTA